VTLPVARRPWTIPAVAEQLGDGAYIRVAECDSDSIPAGHYREHALADGIKNQDSPGIPRDTAHSP
jgi:hypothetical protein